ncbi:hypothetical protein CVT26_002458 [Gymnopilus dilepis]|uniref:Uncharacterized protein n=1 Tax=Gymnopilus dilepis TaxID=231916 RepID=A0A409VT04_9AGAR|nr:hypothetical protein CVT26_002458 [Gymnopilus dilepis]
MTQPTCSNLLVTSELDAFRLLAAVRSGALRLVETRLDESDRRALCAGSVFVWEECESSKTSPGIVRFTDGRRWGRSSWFERVRENVILFLLISNPPLVFYSMLRNTMDLRKCFDDKSSRNSSNLVDSVDGCIPPLQWEGLFKMTYAALVQTDNGVRKWHITSYFTRCSLPWLYSVDVYPPLSGLLLDEGSIKSARLSQRGQRSRVSAKKFDFRKHTKRAALRRARLSHSPSSECLKSGDERYLFKRVAPFSGSHSAIQILRKGYATYVDSRSFRSLDHRTN